jgi:hypothetical protein
MNEFASIDVIKYMIVLTLSTTNTHVTNTGCKMISKSQVMPSNPEALEPDVEGNVGL